MGTLTSDNVWCGGRRLRQRGAVLGKAIIAATDTSAISRGAAVNSQSGRGRGAGRPAGRIVGAIGKKLLLQPFPPAYKCSDARMFKTKNADAKSWRSEGPHRERGNGSSAADLGTLARKKHQQRHYNKLSMQMKQSCVCVCFEPRGTFQLVCRVRACIRAA